MSSAPFQAPNANGFMERYVGTVRRECLDRMLTVAHRQLDQVPCIYIRHYNHTRDRIERSTYTRPIRPSQDPFNPSRAPASTGQTTGPAPRPHPRIRTRRRMTIGFAHPTGPVIARIWFPAPTRSPTETSAVS